MWDTINAVEDGGDNPFGNPGSTILDQFDDINQQQHLVAVQADLKSALDGNKSSFQPHSVPLVALNTHRDDYTAVLQDTYDWVSSVTELQPDLQAKAKTIEDAFVISANQVDDVKEALTRTRPSGHSSATSCGD